MRVSRAWWSGRPTTGPSIEALDENRLDFATACSIEHLLAKFSLGCAGADLFDLHSDVHPPFAAYSRMSA